MNKFDWVQIIAGVVMLGGAAIVVFETLVVVFMSLFRDAGAFLPTMGEMARNSLSWKILIASSVLYLVMAVIRRIRGPFRPKVGGVSLWSTHDHGHRHQPHNVVDFKHKPTIRGRRKKASGGS